MCVLWRTIVVSRNAATIESAGGLALIQQFEWGEEEQLAELLAKHGPFDFIVRAPYCRCPCLACHMCRH